MSSSATCLEMDRLHRYVRRELVRQKKTVERNPQDPDWGKSTIGLVKSFWDFLKPETDRGELLSDVFSGFPQCPEVEREMELDCVSPTEGQLDDNIQRFFEEEIDVRFVPPRDAWKPLRTKVVKVDRFLPNLEP